MKKIKKYFRAFTFIELLVVVTIIGILSTLVVLNLQNSRAKARNSQRKSDLNTIASALETYYADYSGYPHSEGIWLTDPNPQVAPNYSGFYTGVRNVAHSASVYRINCANLEASWPATAEYCREGAGWLWQLPSKGYIDKVPADPFNYMGTAWNTFPPDTILNQGTGRPGLIYIYFNDEPDWDACSYGWDHGYAQTYKLFAALERPNADRDWINDGGAYPPPGASQNVIEAYSVPIDDIITPVGNIDLGGIEMGMMYEVYSAGGSQAFGEFATNLITLEALRHGHNYPEDCY